MNIVFFGSAQFAVPSLKILLTTQHRISCVVTQPDRHKGRGLAMAGTPVKMVAEKEGLKIYQPEDINTAEAVGALKSLSPDIFAVIAYGQILSPEILEIPKILSINLHASLLPKYRGAAPINWALINGETVTGVTIIKMVHRMDAGPIIGQKKINVTDEDTSITLEEKLAGHGAHLLLECLRAIENDKYDLVQQDAEKIVFAPKLKKEDGLIKWDKSAWNIYNLIRGCVGWPGAFTYYRGKLLRINQAGVAKFAALANRNLPGIIAEISKEGIFVGTGKDLLVIRELQIEGKKSMSVQEFIAGHRIGVGETFSDKK